MSKGKFLSRTNCNIYNKMNKEARVLMAPPSPYPDGKSSYINARELALSRHKISDESMNKDIMEIIESAACGCQKESGPVLIKKDNIIFTHLIELF